MSRHAPEKSRAGFRPRWVAPDHMRRSAASRTAAPMPTSGSPSTFSPLSRAEQRIDGIFGPALANRLAVRKPFGLAFTGRRAFLNPIEDDHPVSDPPFACALFEPVDRKS